MLLEYFKNDYHGSTSHPASAVLRSFVGFGSSDKAEKTYSNTKAFYNKSIVFIQKISNELSDLTGFADGSVVLTSFEFAKFNGKTQNALLIKEDSDIYNIFKEVEPQKIKRLVPIKSIFHDEMLAGIHVTSATVLINSGHRFGELDDIYNNLQEMAKEARDNGLNYIEIEGLKLYLYPILDFINENDVEYTLKNNIVSADVFNTYGASYTY